MANVRVGVAWRRDGGNAAHRADLQALGKLKDVDLFSLVWQGAGEAQGLNKAGIADIDVLVIPGGPHANDTQVSLTQKTRSAPKDKDKGYASARAASETDLIERARYLGMPVLAICGGSWRLLENYRGKTIELGSLTNAGKLNQTGVTNTVLEQQHTGDMNHVGTEFKHGAVIEPGTMLHSAVAQTAQKGAAPVGLEVNSVHWAVPYEGEKMGKLPPNQRSYPGIDPNGQLKVNARDSGNARTVEGFEAVSGAPVVGLQWHPEHMTPLPNGAAHGENQFQTSSREINLAAMQYVISAGSAYRTRRDMVSEIQENLRSEEKGNSALEIAKGNLAKYAVAAVTPIASVKFRAEEKPVARKFSAPPMLPGEKTLPTPAEMTKGEYYVRKYLGSLGGKRWQLKRDEWQNLLEMKPLSTIRENSDLDYRMLGETIAATDWLPRFIDKADLIKTQAKTLEGSKESKESKD